MHKNWIWVIYWILFRVLQSESCSSHFLRRWNVIRIAISHYRDVDPEESLSQTTGAGLCSLSSGNHPVLLLHHAWSNKNRSHRTLLGILLRMHCLRGIHYEGLSSSSWKSFILSGLLYALQGKIENIECTSTFFHALFSRIDLSALYGRNQEEKRFSFQTTWLIIKFLIQLTFRTWHLKIGKYSSKFGMHQKFPKLNIAVRSFIAIWNIFLWNSLQWYPANLLVLKYLI